MLPNPTGKRVIILVGPYSGTEGVCLGLSADGTKWMVSPDSSNEIIPMVFDTEFGILNLMDN
jgi:hypothetical protein